MADWVKQYTDLEAALDTAVHAEQRRALYDRFLQRGTGGEDNAAVAAALQCSARDLVLARGKLTVEELQASGSVLLQYVSL